MAEREGFEPSVRKAHNGFRDRPVRPLRHLSGEPERLARHTATSNRRPYRGVVEQKKDNRLSRWATTPAPLRGTRAFSASYCD